MQSWSLSSEIVGSKSLQGKVRAASTAQKAVLPCKWCLALLIAKPQEAAGTIPAAISLCACMHGVLCKASAATPPSTSPSWPMPCIAGAPHFVKDLASVSAGQAKTIVVLNPDKAVVSTNFLSLVACLHVLCFYACCQAPHALLHAALTWLALGCRTQ